QVHRVEPLGPRGHPLAGRLHRGQGVAVLMVERPLDHPHHPALRQVDGGDQLHGPPPPAPGWDSGAGWEPAAGAGPGRPPASSSSTRRPLVEGTPSTRGSKPVAWSKARATALKAASTTWWSFSPSSWWMWRAKPPRVARAQIGRAHV